MLPRWLCNIRARSFGGSDVLLASQRILQLGVGRNMDRRSEEGAQNCFSRKGVQADRSLWHRSCFWFPCGTPLRAGLPRSYSHLSAVWPGWQGKNPPNQTVVTTGPAAAASAWLRSAPVLAGSYNIQRDAAAGAGASRLSLERARAQITELLPCLGIGPSDSMPISVGYLGRLLEVGGEGIIQTTQLSWLNYPGSLFKLLLQSRMRGRTIQS